MKLIIDIDGERKEIDLSEEVVKALTEISERNGLTIEGALMQALANENFIEQVEASGGKLLIKKDDGELREVVRELA